MELDRQAEVPLYRQIAAAITADIRRGRLRPGDVLPGTRTLARTTGVQRMTVVAAFDDLLAEGWIQTLPRVGTVVSPELPELPRISAGKSHVTVASVPARTLFELTPAPPDEMPYDIPPGALFFAPNRPDIRLIPGDLIGRAYRRAIRHGGDQLLGYGRPLGHERLRVAIASMLSATRGIAAGADQVCITRGSQMGLALLAHAILRPGDVVAVEELGYRPALEVFRGQRAQIVSIPLDAEGMQIDALEAVAKKGELRAVHITPHHQFPTTVTLSAARRLRLLELARQERFAIIEEDYDNEFHYDGTPVLPLASADRWGVVAYIGTFSKVLAPALRIGYVAGPRTLVKSLAAHRLYIDVQGDRVLEFALATLIEEGQIQRHIRRMRREYKARRDALSYELGRQLPGALTFQTPAGGIGLWVRAEEGVDIDAWAKRARERGALMITAREFSVHGRSRPFARLGFACLNEAELKEGVRRLALGLR